MSNQTNNAPHHARHFASKPNASTFGSRSTAAREGDSSKDVASHEAHAKKNIAPTPNPAAIPNPAEPQGYDSIDEPDVVTGNAGAAAPSPESIPASGDAEATRLVLPTEVPSLGVSPAEVPSIDGPANMDGLAYNGLADEYAPDESGLFSLDQDPEATRLVSGDDAEATRLVSSDSEATRLVSPDDAEATRLVGTPGAASGANSASANSDGHNAGETTQAVPTQFQPHEDVPGRPHFPEHGLGDDPTQPDGVRLAKNEVAAVPVQHTGYVNDNASPYISKRQAEKTPEERHHTRNVITAVVMLLIVAAIGVGCYLFYRNFMANTQGDETPQYDTATIESGEFVDSIDDSTILRPVQEQGVYPTVEGTIATVNVQEGQTVQKGDTLYTLSNQTITDEATKAKQAVDQAQQDVDSKTTTSTSAQKDLDDANKALTDAQTSIEQLLGISTGTLSSITTQEKAETDPNNPSDALKALEKTVTDAEAKLSDSDKSKYAELQTQLQTATDKVTECQAKVDSAKSELDSANQNLTTLKDAYNKAAEQEKKLTITAPFSGTITNVSDSATQSASVTSTTSLCTVSDTSKLIVVISVPESKLSQVSKGQDVRITFPDVSDLNVTATVTKIGTTASTSSTGEATYPVTVTITDPDERLQSGMTANASIILQSIPNSLIVPIDAVQENADGSTYLDVLLDPSRGIDTKVTVTVKAKSDTQAAVESPNIQSDTKVILPSNSSDESASTSSSDANATDSSTASDSSSSGSSN